MERLKSMRFGSRELLLPCFVPSVSSIRTSLAPSQYVQVLSGLQCPQFLISAYDYERSSNDQKDVLAKYIEEAQRNGCVVVLDSGNFEAFWRSDKQWSTELFWSASKILKPDVTFSFDELDPPNDWEGASATAISRVDLDSKALPGQTVLPIVHGNSANLPLVVFDVVKKIRPRMVVVPERELGDGIIERCRTLAGIRARLNELDTYCPIHLLGTGNPYSILTFVLSGADSFDGLEWCQSVADFSSGQLSHFQHWDLFAASSPLAGARDVPYQQKTLAHNLAFWAGLMKEVREYLRDGTPTPLIDEILSKVRPVLPQELR